MHQMAITPLKLAMSRCFETSVRVYYEDTDAGGVVYYANYLRFMERARTEWLGELGFEIDQLVDEQGVMFVVRSASVDYMRPARLNDRLIVSVSMQQYAGASFSVNQAVTFANTSERLVEGSTRVTACKGSIRLACVDARTHRPRRLPKELLQELNAWTK